jgi:hypothetical protein
MGINFNFKSELVYNVQEGYKNTTIRKPITTKGRDVGDIVKLQTGSRYKPEVIGQTEIVKKVRIQITKDRKIIPLSEATMRTRVGESMKPEEVKELALRDGFKDVNGFFTFFETTYDLPGDFDLFFFRPLVRLRGFREVIVWRHEK